MPIEDTSRSTPDPGAPADTISRRALWKWTLVLTATIVLILMWQCGAALMRGRHLANTAVQHFHQQLNEGKYDDICHEVDEEFINRKELTKLLEAVHSKMGNAESETLMNVRVSATTSGSITTTQYKTMFAHGLGIETFTWVTTGERLKLRGYSIQSSAFLAQ